MSTITKRAPELVDGPVKEPAKRWTNKWFILPGKRVRNPDGEVIFGPCRAVDAQTQPSKEIAQQVAIRNARAGWGRMEHIDTVEVP